MFHALIVTVRSWPLYAEVNMIYALEERIGEPSLFYGRKQETELLLNWALNIPDKQSRVGWRQPVQDIH